MKKLGYDEKRDAAFKEHDAVQKLMHKDMKPKGAEKYMKMRKADLKKVRGY